MNNENVRFRAGPLPEDFIQMLAKFAHTTVSKIKEMVATCILCEQEAVFAVVGIDQNWREIGTIKMMLCGLCEPCSMLHDVLAKAEAVALKDSVELVCLETYAVYSLR